MGPAAALGGQWHARHHGGRCSISQSADLICGDSRDVLKTLPDASVSSIITDPPAGISFMSAAWDGNRGGRDAWVAWLAAILSEARRVLVPGGYALVWALPRTSHWTALALEDAGFTLRESVMHVFGSGFPKSHSCLKPAYETWWLAKAPGPLQPLGIDACRVVGAKPSVPQPQFNSPTGAIYGFKAGEGRNGGMSDNSQGRWPPNLLLSHHESCTPTGVRRVRSNGSANKSHRTREASGYSGAWGVMDRPWGQADAEGYEQVQTWDCHPECAVAALDRQAGERPSKMGGSSPRSGFWGQSGGCAGVRRDDAGGPSRFFPVFYSPKASRRERNAGLDGMPVDGDRPLGFSQRAGQTNGSGQTMGPSAPQANTNPCVKPLALCRWLTKLITPPGGTILDPFAGSASIGCAALQEGFSYLGIEMSEEYAAIGRARLAHAFEAQEVVQWPLPLS